MRRAGTWSAPPGASAAAYDRALRQAEAACRLVPHDGNYLNTLAAAQYRIGKYHEAVATLKRSGPLNATVQDGPLPEDLAFLVLAEHRLGHTASADGPQSPEGGHEEPEVVRR